MSRRTTTKKTPADWPVLFRVGDVVMNVVITEAQLKNVEALHGSSGIKYRPRDRALILDPTSITGLNCALDQRVQQWRHDIIWETDMLWRDLKINYSAVWLLLASLLNNSAELKSSDLLTALSAAKLGTSTDPTELRYFGCKDAEHAHRLLQQYLMKG